MITALLDACVLYPPAIRDLFMWLAAEMVYQPRWSEAIHEEWMHSVLADRPDLTREQLKRTRRLMDQIDPESLVSGYEGHIEALHLPDEDDRHVLAAAIKAGAQFIVTFNLSDFPGPTLARYGVQALHPDTFLLALLEQEPEGCMEAVRKHRASLGRPPKTVDEYLRTLETNGLAALAAELEVLCGWH